MIYAVYRALYGEDFIQESILSIIDKVDIIFFFWCDKPLANVSSCIYKGEKIDFPKKIDNIYDKVLYLKTLYGEKIQIIYDYVENNDNQFTHLVNNLILPFYPKPDYVLFIEHDHVFRKDQFDLALQTIEDNKTFHAIGTRQVELWRTPLYRIPEREGRLSCVFWNLKILEKIPPTGKHANISGIGFMNAYVHNMGFCMSEKNMYWKHLLSIGFSQAIKDSEPNELWYDKWKNWSLSSGNKDLEISKGFESSIPYAYLYEVNELPELIIKKFKLEG